MSKLSEESKEMMNKVDKGEEDLFDEEGVIEISKEAKDA